MWKPSTLAIAVMVLGCTCFLWSQSSAPPQLPDGAMKAKVTTACTECHEARIILQQRLSKATWAKEVDKMIKWGALVRPDDRDGFIDYLSSNFPADKAPYIAPRMKP